jgi:3-dehydroquinate synthase
MLKNCFSYPVEIVEDVFGQSETLAKLLRQITGAEEPRVLLVADVNVVNRTEALGSKIGRYFQAHSIKMAASPVVIPGGEKIKADSMQSASKVISAILDARLGVNDVVIVMGGGSLIDVAGYAAAQVRGGIKQLRLPTTLAAMVDAAYSTYSALDSVNVKDALRIHCSPAAVIVDPLFSKTVLDGVWRGGFSEAVRYAAVADAALMKKIAARAEAIKAREYEPMKASIEECIASRRKNGFAGNFALWSAMRLEAMSGYKLPYGYAVAIAICIDCAYAAAKGVLKESDQQLICSALSQCGALDGLVHSRHLLSQPESIILGLESLMLVTGRREIMLCSGIGKSVCDVEPDKEALAGVVEEFYMASQAG